MRKGGSQGEERGEGGRGGGVMARTRKRGLDYKNSHEIEEGG